MREYSQADRIGPPPGTAARAGVVVDWLAGLSDRGAMDVYEALFEPYERALAAVDAR